MVHAERGIEASEFLSVPDIILPSQYFGSMVGV
jgi:hypothetical protein